jgi:transcriptional regulator with PAS, ATPase and Fis domain
MGILNLALVTGSRATAEALEQQLREYIHESCAIVCYTVDEGISKPISEEIIVISSQVLYEELMASGLLSPFSELIIARRTINFDFLDQVVGLERGMTCLLVNDLHTTALEVIEDLKRIGLLHIHYVPFSPENESADDNSHIHCAITPGELQNVPPWITQVVDIGPRILDFSTLTQILSKLNILDERAGMFSQRYLEKITHVAFRLSESRNQVAELNAHLGKVLECLNDGLLVYQLNGTITVSNENFKKLVTTKFKTHVGKTLGEVITDRQFLEMLQNNKTYQGMLFTLQGRELLMTKSLLFNDSIMVTLKSAQDTMKENDRIKRELQQKGFVAKYTTEDIIGHSDAITKVKDIIVKLAKSNLTILITGESGTGKELIASAVHRASSRSNGPFLAVNFSALSDELIESELFGYEEGSFTGAKKGGKAGLFEQADGGTLFLDEIGDVSFKVQTRLLRVLQENEIMRIGANEIRKVDVRIIAATHRDLGLMVNEKKFREDLYYRLKIGYVHAPALRERKEDIADLIRFFVKSSSSALTTVDQGVFETLHAYQWFGNVRELKNTIAYMMAVMSDHHLTVEEIPNRAFFEGHGDQNTPGIHFTPELSQEEMTILTKIKSVVSQHQVCGREKIALLCAESDCPMTSNQVRHKLEALERKGYVKSGRGKVGTTLTERGEKTLMDNH